MKYILYKYLKRDFSNESIVNSSLRVLGAIKGRVIGFALVKLFCFKSSHVSGVYFRSIPRIINSRSISIGDNVHFGISSRLECFSHNNRTIGKIIIGQNTSFGDYVHIGSVNEITIGRNVLGGSKLLIIDHNHGEPKKDMESKNITPPRNRPIVSRNSVTISDNVWIGDNAIILQGADIGFGAIIPANTIVNGRVEPFTIYNR